MKTKISLIIAVVIVLSLSGMAGANLVNSNSKLEDGIEYYIQTDKAVYYLGENVQMLYRITNLGDEDVTFSSLPLPEWNFWVEKDGEYIWRAVNVWWGTITEFTLSPGESREFPTLNPPYVWDMRDDEDNLVTVGDYSVIGGLYEGSGYYDYTKVNVPIEIIPEPAVDAGIDIKPDTLNLKGKGKWITCYIWLPEDYNVAEIVPDSIFLERMIKPVWTWVDEEQQLAMAKFSRSEVQGILEVGELELTISGQLIDGMTFEGTDTIRVIDKGRSHKGRVNSNSKVVDGIEYYIQTDKAVYNLGENVEMLYRITNLGNEDVTFGYFALPVWNFWVEKKGEVIWRAVNLWYGTVTEFTLSPGESKEFPAHDHPRIWNMRDKENNLVNAGKYSVIGGLYNGSGSCDYTKVAAPIRIVPKPAHASPKNK